MGGARDRQAQGRAFALQLDKGFDQQFQPLIRGKRGEEQQFARLRFLQQFGFVVRADRHMGTIHTSCG